MDRPSRQASQAQQAAPCPAQHHIGSGMMESVGHREGLGAVHSSWICYNSHGTATSHDANSSTHFFLNLSPFSDCLKKNIPCSFHYKPAKFTPKWLTLSPRGKVLSATCVRESLWGNFILSPYEIYYFLIKWKSKDVGGNLQMDTKMKKLWWIAKHV